MGKKILITSIVLLALAVIAIVALYQNGSKMREISSEIEIEASPEVVWAILADTENWAEWNPIVLETSGAPSLNATLSVTMRGKDGGEGSKYAPMITEFKEPEIIRWRAKMMAEFLFTNDKVLELQATETGTKLIHKESFKGLMVPLFWGKMESGVPGMLEMMNQACKEKAEG